MNVPEKNREDLRASQSRARIVLTFGGLVSEHITAHVSKSAWRAAAPIICFIGFLRRRTDDSSGGLVLWQYSGRYSSRTRYLARKRLLKIAKKGRPGASFGELGDYKRLKMVQMSNSMENKNPYSKSWRFGKCFTNIILTFICHFFNF